MTDREVMMALYSAIEKLYFDLLGKPLRIRVPLEDGTFIGIQSSDLTTQTCSAGESAA